MRPVGVLDSISVESVLLQLLYVHRSPNALILILSGSHGTEEGKEGRIVDGGMMIEYLLQETQL